MENSNTKKECEKCSYCGASMKEFWHTLTPGLVSILIKAIKQVQKTGKNKFHYKDLNLNYSEASNLQKLRLHGLITHNDKEHIKNGEWLITTRGGSFLRGEVSIPKKVKTFRNKVIGHGDETIHINQVKHKFPDFQSKFAYEIQPMSGDLKAPEKISLFRSLKIEVVEGPNGERIAKYA